MDVVPSSSHSTTEREEREGEMEREIKGGMEGREEGGMGEREGVEERDVTASNDDFNFTNHLHQ